jgi:hypothetical protein
MTTEDRLEEAITDIARKTHVNVTLQFLRDLKERLFELHRQIDVEVEVAAGIRSDIAEIIGNIERGMLVNAEQIADVLRKLIGEDDDAAQTQSDSGTSPGSPGRDWSQLSGGVRLREVADSDRGVD